MTGFPVELALGIDRSRKAPWASVITLCPSSARHPTPTVLLNPYQRHQGPGDRLARNIDDLSGQVAECLRVRLRQRDLDDELSAVEPGLRPALVRPRDGGCLPVVIAQTVLRGRTSQVRRPIRRDRGGSPTSTPRSPGPESAAMSVSPALDRDLALLGGEGQADTACFVHGATGRKRPCRKP